MSLKDALEDVSIEEVRRRLANTPSHTFYSQMVADVKDLRLLAEKIPFCRDLLKDIEQVSKQKELLLFMCGMACMLNVVARAEGDLE